MQNIIPLKKPQDLWDPHKEIDIAKDQEKKHGLFVRCRSESDLDKQLDHVFSKLYELYERTIIDKARIIFGSNLVELRFSNNPFCPKAYSLDAFLNLEIENQFDFEICTEMTQEDIALSLSAMKSLRYKKSEYLEAFRLNAYSGNAWSYFSSSSSLISDYHTFLNYVKFRFDKDTSHDQALEQVQNKTGFFRGEQEFYDNRNLLTRQESLMDTNIDKLIDITLDMFSQNQVFEVQYYLGSGVIRMITPSDPYTTYAFSGVDELFLANQNYTSKTMTQKSSLANKNFNRPNLRMNRNLVFNAFHAAKAYRLADENLYLRVFYIDFMYNKVLTSFSCGGTRYQNTEKFISDYQATLNAN